MHLPILRLYFSGVLEYSHVDEQVLGRLQASCKVDVCPLAFVGSQQITVLSHVFFFLGRKTTLRPHRIALASAGLLRLLLEHVDTIPALLFQLVTAYFVIREEAAFVASHA